jgi:hypothetical protein
LKKGAPGNVERLTTDPPQAFAQDGQSLIKNSRIRFGRNRSDIEERIARFLAPEVHSKKR